MGQQEFQADGSERSEQQFVVAQSGKAIADAEKRSKVKIVSYRVAWGVQLRRKLNLTTGQKYGFISVFVVVCLLFWMLKVSLVIGINWYCALASLLLLFAAVLAQQDTLYLDRLSLIIPGRNFLLPNPKVNWHRIEELSIVDLAKKGRPSQFALRFTDIDGEHHHILLAALDRESIPELVSHIETYAGHIRGLVQLKELTRFHDYQNKKLEGLSYTQLWESSADIQFGLTSFTPLPKGAVLQNAYTVVKQIAAGGFSAIYLVHDSNNQNYVLKESVVPPKLDEGLKTKAQEQFARESKLLSRLNHAHIANVYDHFVEDGRSYLRMQYIDGPNLRLSIAKQPASEATAIRWMEELLDILVYLHGLTPPIVHRDLSPDNIVVGPDGRLVLIDFGAANEFIGAATGTLVGKHAYMAPEQIRGSAEPLSDLYALGACAYFAVTARDPEPISRSSPRSAGANVSDWFDQLVKRLTSLDREERFSSAAECLNYVRKPIAASSHADTEG